MFMVQFDDYLIGQTCDGWCNTNSCCWNNLTIFSDITSFNDCYIHLTKKTITEFLSQVRKMHIKITDIARI